MRGEERYEKGRGKKRRKSGGERTKGRERLEGRGQRVRERGWRGEGKGREKTIRMCRKCALVSALSKSKKTKKGPNRNQVSQNKINKKTINYIIFCLKTYILSSIHRCL